MPPTEYAAGSGAPIADADAVETFSRIPLEHLQPSPTNPRKSFNQAKLAELAESIKASGVHQPILVRRMPLRMLAGAIEASNELARYEIVSGERRYRASLFAGVITAKDGTHCAVALLSARGEDLTWKKAVGWAKEQGGELPTRPVAALIFANVKDRPQEGWHWTSEEHTASFAWYCSFDYGYQGGDRKSYEGRAVAVRMIPIAL